MVFNASDLSQENILRDVHDTSNQSLRVSAFSVPPPGGVEVIITHTDDSIRLGDGVSLITSTPVGGKQGLDVNLINTSILVTTSPVQGDPTVSPKYYYNEVTSVPNGVLTTILNYTVPSGKETYMDKAYFSGTNIAEYTIKLNGVVVDKRRTFFGAPLNDFFNFGSSFGLPAKVTAGQTIQVQVIHNRPSVGDFNVRIDVIEKG